MTEQRTASLRPSEAVQGGLLDDADVIVKEARFALWDYNGQADAGPALRVAMEDADGKLHEQYYSAGKSDRYVPSEDGTKLLLTGTATGLNASSNVAAFMKSLVDSGIAESYFADDISVLDGARIHVNRVNQQKRAGLQGGDDKQRTILLATKLIALPGQKPAGAKAAAKVTQTAKATTTAAPAAVDGDLSDKAIVYIANAVAGGPVARQKISQLVFQAAQAAKDGDKSKLTTLVFDEKFLTANSGRPVESNGEIVSFEYDAASKTISGVPVAA